MRFILFVATLLFLVTAQAQVRKCTGPDGKVTYSDFVCAGSTVNETSVNTNANHLDRSGERREVEKFKTAEMVEQATHQGASKCKFSYYAIGDSKGKELAAAAKRECLNNIAAKVTGQPTTLEAYNFWRDHTTQKSADRQAALNRASAAANAQAIANSNRDAIGAAAAQNANRTITCKPTYLNSLECR